MFVRGAEIVLICIDQPNTLLMDHHIREIRNIELNVKIILVMTKVDEYFSHREEMKEYAENKELKIFFTSALTGEGVRELVEEIARHFISLGSIGNTGFNLETIDSNQSTFNDESITKCCITM
jgi:tRNA U34 5-carboxymethylaminomethyl modifying GTPase MnmE/TrmE